MKRKSSTANNTGELICRECGNKERFVEVMEVEWHLVNARKEYIRLLEGIPDHYFCIECGATVQDATAKAA